MSKIEVSSERIYAQYEFETDSAIRSCFDEAASELLSGHSPAEVFSGLVYNWSTTNYYIPPGTQSCDEEKMDARASVYLKNTLNTLFVQKCEELGVEPEKALHEILRLGAFMIDFCQTMFIAKPEIDYIETPTESIFEP